MKLPSQRLTIVFLDASTVDRGDVNTSLLEAYGSYCFYPLTAPKQLVSRAQDATIIITNKCLLGKREMTELPRLKLICGAATGIDNIDLEAARGLGIAVTNVAGYSTRTVAEHALMFMLACGHHLLAQYRASIDGSWPQSPSFALLDYPYSDLKGRTVGIIGYGAIGRQVAKLAKAFKMKVLIAKLPGRTYRKTPPRLSLEQVLQRSDFVSLHCPLTAKTHYLINRERLQLMKRSAYLLNLARGPIVNEAHVASALRRNHIAGYAADVMEQEPPPANHPFFQPDIRDKVLLTPHIAWASRESRQRLINEIGKNIASFLQGRRRNRVV